MENPFPTRERLERVPRRRLRNVPKAASRAINQDAMSEEFPAVNDYTSHGCIKMSPTDLTDLVRLYHRHFGAGVRYPKGRVVLRVIN